MGIPNIPYSSMITLFIYGHDDLLIGFLHWDGSIIWYGQLRLIKSQIPSKSLLIYCPLCTLELYNKLQSVSFFLIYIAPNTKSK